MDKLDNKQERRFFKIPQTKRTIFLNILFAAGLILMIAGVFFLVYSYSDMGAFPLLPLIYFSVGIISLVLTFGFTQSSTLLTIAIIFMFWGLVSLLSVTGIIPYSQTQLWPFAVIASGVALFTAGFYKFHKIKSSFLFPALSLVGFGAIFLLFSMDIINQSFAEFVGRWWPVVFIIGGGVLILIFILQKNNVKDFPYMEDDESVIEMDGEE